MKPFVGLLGLLLLLSFMKTCADDWTAISLQCADHWFHLRIRPTIFHNIFMEPDEVFLGIGCPVTTTWPNDTYEFIYRTYSCGIANKVLCDVTLLKTQLTYISKNASLQAEMSLSCVMHNQSPHFCEAESRGDFTGDPPGWTEDMRARRDEQTVPMVQPNGAVREVCRMGVSMALEVLVYLAVLVWTCAWDIDVDVSCSQDWMTVSVSAFSQNKRNPYIFADELYLGQNCRVTQIHAHQYDFIYPVSHCGIRTKVISNEIVCFETEMYFRPRNYCLELQIVPLQCSASRKSVWLMPLSTEEDPKPVKSPFMTDFEATPEELGLLNAHQAASSQNKR